MTDKQENSGPNPWIKLALEMGPLGLFFYLNANYDLMVATGGFMIATVISLVASKVLLGKLPTMPLIGAVFILIFGGLTLVLNDEIFIKLKPTIVNAMFGTALLVAQLGFNKPLLKVVMGDVMPLQTEGWRILSIRWGLFFFVLAGLNEFVWRTFDTDTWVSFKVFGILPLTLAFTMSQVPTMTKYALDESSKTKEN